MDAPVGNNPLDNVEPHRFLRPEARAALWAACQRVLARPGDFAEALAWLHEGYSEAALYQRELAKVDRICREDLRQVRHGRDRCDTFPRRKALRHGTPREVLVRETLQTARLRGWRIEGDKVIQDARADAANPITADEVDVVWRRLDEQCREQVRRIKDNHAKRRATCRKRAEDRGWRLQQAIEDALETGLPAGQDEVLYARRVVLLACLLSWPHELPLAGEFASWPWNNEGHYPPLIGERFVPGRQTALFCPAHPTNETLAPAALNTGNLGPFADLVARAVRVLAGDPAATAPSTKLMRPDERGVPGSRIPGKAISWQVAMKAAEAHCARNPFPGVNALAKIICCSPATIRKAIKNSACLRRKMAEISCPSMQGAAMTEMIAENAQQTREEDPAKAAEAAELQEKQAQIDADPVLRKLMSEIPPHHKRAFLENTSIRRMQKIAEIKYNDPDASERVRGRSR